MRIFNLLINRLSSLWNIDEELKKESATYDSWETDSIHTDQLRSRDDYGGAPKGPNTFWDFLGDSQNFGEPHEKGGKHNFRAWWKWHAEDELRRQMIEEAKKKAKQKKDEEERRRVGREDDYGAGEQDVDDKGAGGDREFEVGPHQGTPSADYTRGFTDLQWGNSFMGMPMQKSAISHKDLIEKESAFNFEKELERYKERRLASLPELSDEDIAERLKVIVSYDPTPKKKFAKWLVNIDITESLIGDRSWDNYLRTKKNEEFNSFNTVVSQEVEKLLKEFEELAAARYQIDPSGEERQKWQEERYDYLKNNGIQKPKELMDIIYAQYRGQVEEGIPHGIEYSLSPDYFSKEFLERIKERADVLFKQRMENSYSFSTLRNQLEPIRDLLGRYDKVINGPRFVTPDGHGRKQKPEEMCKCGSNRSYGECCGEKIPVMREEVAVEIDGNEEARREAEEERERKISRNIFEYKDVDALKDAVYNAEQQVDAAMRQRAAVTEARKIRNMITEHYEPLIHYEGPEGIILLANPKQASDIAHKVAPKTDFCFKIHDSDDPDHEPWETPDPVKEATHMFLFKSGFLEAVVGVGGHDEYEFTDGNNGDLRERLKKDKRYVERVIPLLERAIPLTPVLGAYILETREEDPQEILEKDAEILSGVEKIMQEYSWHIKPSLSSLPFITEEELETAPDSLKKEIADAKEVAARHIEDGRLHIAKASDEWNAGDHGRPGTSSIFAIQQALSDVAGKIPDLLKQEGVFKAAAAYPTAVLIRHPEVHKRYPILLKLATDVQACNILEAHPDLFDEVHWEQYASDGLKFQAISELLMEQPQLAEKEIPVLPREFDPAYQSISGSSSGWRIPSNAYGDTSAFKQVSLIDILADFEKWAGDGRSRDIHEGIYTKALIVEHPEFADKLKKNIKDVRIARKLLEEVGDKLSEDARYYFKTVIWGWREKARARGYYETPVKKKLFKEALAASELNSVKLKAERYHEEGEIHPMYKEDLLLQKEREEKHREKHPPKFTKKHISVTFDFTEESVKIVCTWDRDDFPAGIGEKQILKRVLEFLKMNIPPALEGLKNIRRDEVDLINRTISFRADK